MHQQESHLMVVDSFALLFRGYFASAMMRPPVRNEKGYFTNGLQQMLRYMADAVNTFRPSHLVCAMDMGKETFRNQIYPQYKANRGEPPDELVPQFGLLTAVLDAYEIPVIGIQGYEADDVIGSIARRYAGQGVRVSILSGDGDVLQLLQPGVDVILMKKGFANYHHVALEQLPEYKGLSRAEQMVDLKALMGDSSDNIPGCPNVGEKTALKLLQQYDSLVGVFAALAQLPAKLADNLRQHREQIELSQRLAEIRCDLDFECIFERSQLQWDAMRMTATLSELGIRPVKMKDK